MFECLLKDLVGGSAGLQERADGIAFLKVAKSVYPLANIAYLALNIPLPGPRKRFVQCTYTDQWVKYCVSLAPLDVGRVGGLDRALREPIDWSETDPSPARHGEPLRAYMPSTADGHRLLSFPLRALFGERALFCVSAEMADGEWQRQKKRVLTDFQVLANYFHQHILRIHGHDAENAILMSARELDCLKWMAAGKTAWEASRILGISERTVRFHLNAAREKLNCLTTTQAVAKAVAQQLI
ncbi:MAG TPA: LuxR C-terminal-related transcriptional regulator [Hyphomicrobiaceae bacterium]|nr:LuxR C-terminal-related transcriptional regulator [Hyphomicrobiaceae bacterium]